MRFRSRVNLALGTGLVLALAFAFSGYATINALLEDARAERASQDAVLQLERTLSQLKTAEGWQRKFLITLDPADLKAYQLSVAQARHALDRSRDALAARDGQRLMPALEAVIARRLANMETGVRMRQEADLAAASAHVGSAENTALRQQIDALLDQIKANEQAALHEARAETQDGAQAVKAWLVAAAVLTAGLLAWALYLVNLYTVRRQAAEARLALNVNQLERVSGALRESEAQLREVLDTVPLLFGYADRQQRVCFHNRAYAESLGRRGDAILGRTLREVLGPTMYEAARPHIEQAFDGHAVTYERSQRRADGTVRDYEIKYFPRFGQGDEGGTVVGVYAMGSDVTEARRLDRMKSEFVSTVSHELRTPLTSIRGSLGLMAGGVAGPLPPKALPLVEIARDSCERLVRLVNDILDLDKLEAGQMPLQLVRQPVAGLLRQVIADNEGLAGQHGVRLALDAAEGPLAADLDLDRFVQVVTNLVSNAVRFSPSGEAVTVRLLQRGECLRVEVSDAGPGIPEEFRSRIFQKFAQADASSTRTKSGSGLGLSISKALVERMGGTIGYERCAGRTVFFVEFPQVAAGADAAVTGASA